VVDGDVEVDGWGAVSGAVEVAAADVDERVGASLRQ
jgi:hypothetical protein